MTTKQQKEVEIWEYFKPKNTQWEERNEEDIRRFFEWSEKGLHKELLEIQPYLPEGRTYFHALVWGKKWAGRHVHELYEPGILSGETPYSVILGAYGDKMPRSVVDFLKKEMFKGMDAELIEQCYETV